MRRPDSNIHFWAVPLDISSEYGELGLMTTVKYQDCRNSKISYTTTKSINKNTLSIYDGNENKYLKLSSSTKQVKPVYDVLYHDSCGDTQSTFDFKGQLMTISHSFDVKNEKLKLVADFMDGNQWYLYQYDDDKEIDNKTMLDRGDNIPNQSNFANLQRLTTLFSNLHNEEMGSISLSNRTNFCFILLALSNNPTLGMYIPTRIPVPPGDKDNLKYLAHFPLQEFVIVNLGNDNSNNLPTGTM